MTRIVRAADRFRSEHDGIVSWHVFSAGAHYDPRRLGVGALVAVDEHVVTPGAGFAAHAHRGVDIASRVLAGRLRHDDGEGRSREVGAGGAMVQVTGSGLRHSEMNAGGTELRFVQVTAIGADTTPALAVSQPPFALGGGVLAEHRGGRYETAFAYVLEGSWSVGGSTLGAGDAVWDAGPIEGDGVVLTWSPVLGTEQASGA